MKIVRRYILREHTGPFIAALGVLTGLMLLNQFARRFGDLVGKGLPWYVIAEVFALSIPFIIAMTLPMAVLVAVLHAFGRLTSDNEVTAFKAGGVSLTRLMVPLLLTTSLLAGGMIWFNDKILPETNHALAQLLSDIGRKRPTFELQERVVNEVVSKKLYLQAARIDRMRSVLWDLVIFDLGRTNVNRTIYADSGYMAFNESQTDLYLTLFDGSMNEMDTTDPQVEQRTYYGRQVIRVEDVSNELERGSRADWRGDREMSIGMMRDEVASRRERLLELQDSLLLIVASLDPIRAAEEDSAAVEEDPPSAMNDFRRGRRDLPARQKSAEIADDEERADRELQSDSSPAASLAARRASSEEIRKRFASARAMDWPPRGDAAAFAAQVRSRLDRIATRADLQRREVNKYEVEIQKKYAIPVAAIVFVLIGAPVGVRFPRGGIGMVIGVSLSVFCVYYVFLIGGEDIADRGFLSPFWAMWAPNVIFTLLGLTLLYLVTLGGTRRLPTHRLSSALQRARSGRGGVSQLVPSLVLEVEPAPEGPATVAAPSGYPAGSAEPNRAPLIDLNRAGPTELEELPGIDGVQARAIVLWRKEHGDFLRLADLLAVPGIDRSVLAALDGKVVQGGGLENA